MDVDVHGIIDIIDNDDDSDDDEEPSTSAGGAFATSQQVFIVRGLLRATSGFRPSVTCEGYLAEVSSSLTGYTLSPLGSNQQLSFKYEPPSPKFSRKRPGSLSYRLQLLQGSQFLYSLRGLPKALRCQRAAHALEWGLLHMAFIHAADLDTFLATLKYVTVEEVPEQAEPLAVAEATSAAAEAGPHTALRPQLSFSGEGGVVWPAAAAKLWLEPGAAGSTQPPAAGRRGPGAVWSWLRRCVAGAPGSGAGAAAPEGPSPLPLPLLAATSAAAAVAAAALAAACLVAARSRRGATPGQ